MEYSVPDGGQKPAQYPVSPPVINNKIYLTTAGRLGLISRHRAHRMTKRGGAGRGGANFKLQGWWQVTLRKCEAK